MSIAVTAPSLAPRDEIARRLAPPVDQRTVLEETYTVVAPSDPSLIAISELPGFTTKQFNTLDNVSTRELTISGVLLRWDGSIPKLEALKLTRDVTKITIYADEVIVAQPLLWKRAEVRIHARRLTFRGKGCIDTSPEGFGAQQAFSENQRNGRPVGEDGEYPKDAGGNYQLQGKDGKAGENAGATFLLVGEIAPGEAGVKRLVCNGSSGQTGEPGGTTPFKELEKNPKFSKDAPVLVLEDLTTAINNENNSTGAINGLGHWNYPGDHGETTDLYGGLEGREYFVSKSVTHVRLMLYFQQFLATRLNEVRLPGGGSTNHDMTGGGDVPWDYDIEKRTLPRDGEDAYPSGVTGKGGDGGAVHVAKHLVELVKGVAERAAGESPPSAHVDGGRAGQPNPACYADIFIVEKIWWPLGAPSPAASYVQCDTRPGADAKGSAHGCGAEGAVEPLDDSRGWLHAEVMRIVLSYARTLYANGHREEAFDFLKPYYDALQEIPPDSLNGDVDVLACRHAIDALVQNFQQNLDVYGNPPGWVPRFSADSYFQLYMGDRSFSYKFCYIMTKALSLIDSVEHAHKMLEVVASQTEGAIDRTRGELGAAYRQYHDARDAMDQALEHFAIVQSTLDSIEEQAQHDAAHVEQEKAIIAGVFKVLGAVAKAIPAYQPMLSGVGAVLEGVGGAVANIDPTEDDPQKALGFVKDLAGHVAKTLDDNADTFKSEFDDRLKTKYKDALRDDQDDLSQKIAKTRTSIKEADTDTNKAIIAAHNQLLKDSDLQYLLKKDAVLTDEISALAHDREALRAKIQETNQLIEDLPYVDTENPSNQGRIAGACKQNLVAARAKLYAQLADADRLVDGLREAKSKLEAKTEAHGKAAQDLENAGERRGKLKEKKDALDKLLKEKEKKDAQESMKTANEKFGTVLDATQRLSTGVASVAGKISTMLTPVSEDDQNVQALRDKFLKSKYKKEYEKALENLEAAKQKKTQALIGFQTCNQFILKKTAELNESLRNSIELSRNRQMMALGIDAGVKTAIRDMQRNAAERMDFYLYLVRKAFMYEQLRPVGERMANINQFAARFDQWLASNRASVPALAGSKADWQTDPGGYLAAIDAVAGDDFGRFGNEVLTETLGELAMGIVKHRNEVGAETSSEYEVTLNPTMLSELSSQGSLSIEEVDFLFPDFARLYAEHARIRVADIGLSNDGFEVRCSDDFGGPIRLEISFGREFVLRGDDGESFQFRIGEADKPIQYGFVVNHLSDGPNGARQGTIKADEQRQVDELFETIMAKNFGGSIKYKEMSPSILSPLHIEIPLGAEYIERIDRLSLNISLMFD